MLIGISSQMINSTRLRTSAFCYSGGTLHLLPVTAASPKVNLKEECAVSPPGSMRAAILVAVEQITSFLCDLSLATMAHSVHVLTDPAGASTMKFRPFCSLQHARRGRKPFFVWRLVIAELPRPLLLPFRQD